MKNLTKCMKVVSMVLIGIILFTLLRVMGYAETDTITDNKHNRQPQEVTFQASINDLKYDTDESAFYMLATSSMYGNIFLYNHSGRLGDTITISATNYQGYLTNIRVNTEYKARIKKFYIQNKIVCMQLSSGKRLQVFKIPSLWTKKTIEANLKLLNYGFKNKLFDTFDFNDLDFIENCQAGYNYIDLTELSTGDIISTICIDDAYYNPIM